MNNYQDWAQLVAKKLEHESMLLGAIGKDELDLAKALERLEALVEKYPEQIRYAQTLERVRAIQEATQE